MDAPIIFCHFGATKYLRYSLVCARIHNADKRIILLGDDANRGLADLAGIEHRQFSELEYGPRLATFDEVYRLIEGEAHKGVRHGKDWINFVFRRWFYIANLASELQFERFWHFDSDNMLFDALSKHEAKFEHVDCTEQCNGNCINGFVANAGLIDRYLDKILSLFQRQEYLEDQRRLCAEKAEVAFTEMSAYSTFRLEEDFRRTRLNMIIDGTSFDDCICQPHGMEMESLPQRRSIKKVFMHPTGRFFCRECRSQEMIEMQSLNLSWVPRFVFKNVLEHSRRRLVHTGNGSNKLYEPLSPGQVVSESTTLATMRRPLRVIVPDSVKAGMRAFSFKRNVDSGIS